MIYEYCRVSTQIQAKERRLEVQEQLLIENEAEETYADAFTVATAHRSELDKLLGKLQEEVKLVITKLDRRDRNASQGIGLIQSLLNNIPTRKLIQNIIRYLPFYLAFFLCQ